MEVTIVAAYMLVMLYVAWRVSDKSRDAEGYTVGNRQMAGWVVGFSVLATFTSSISFLAVPAKAYDGNWNVNVFAFSLPPAALIAVLFFVPFYRRNIKLSAYELLEHRFGYWARFYADVSYVVLQLIRIATVLLLVAFAVAPLLDWPIPATLIGLGLLVILYDTLGGIRAVIFTDVIQVVILVFGALWCLGRLFAIYPGGGAALLAEIPAEKLSPGEWASWDLSLPTVLVVIVYGITENLRNYGTDQNYVQRILASKSDRAAANSLWIGALAYVPVSCLFCLIGTSLFMALPLESLEGVERADEVFPYFIKNELPSPVAGLVIAAILAAAMSTVDSSLNSMSTVILVDVFRRFRWTDALRVPEIFILRASTVTLGLIGTFTAVGLFAVFSQQARTIMDLWWQYAGTAGGGMFGLFVLAWVMPRVPVWGAVLGVVATIPVLTWGTFLRDLSDESTYKHLECHLHPYLVGVSGTAVLVLVAALVMIGVQIGMFAPNPRAASNVDSSTDD